MLHKQIELGNTVGRTLNYETVHLTRQNPKGRERDQHNQQRKSRRRRQQNGQHSQVSYFANHVRWNMH
jgi:hypothetical protein